jgi:hypothetical protein
MRSSNDTFDSETLWIQFQKFEFVAASSSTLTMHHPTHSIANVPNLLRSSLQFLEFKCDRSDPHHGHKINNTQKSQA